MVERWGGGLLSMYWCQINIILKRCFKYFFGFFNYFNNIKLLCIKLLKCDTSTKGFEKVKYTKVMVIKKHEGILNKYSEKWDKIKELNGKDFDTEVINKKIQNNKVNSCNKYTFYNER